jgi:hypothetical protein
LWANCASIAAGWPVAPRVGEGVRLSVFGNYVVLHVVHPDLLEIRRVVYGARDLADLD